MFADSVLDVSWDDRSRRSYATLVSFGIEALAVAFLLVAPLLYVHGLPQLQWTSSLVAPPAPAPLLPQSPTHPSARQPASNLNSAGQIIAPTVIPIDVAPIVDHYAPPPVDVSGLRVPGGTGNPFAREIPGATGNGLLNVEPPPATPPVPKSPRISHVMEGNLIYRVQPTYPPMARAARIQGPVILHAIIGRDGRIENLQVLTGHPMLAGAAIEAVRQWRYRPYVLNGEPIEVETQITVNFTLAGG